jgi:sec-independent protein translocase protein TatB
MFDAGLFEILLILVIGLLVLGPERLPRVARTVGLWLGKANRMFETVKAEVSKELAAEELKQNLKKQAASRELFEIVEDTKSGLDELNKPLDEPEEPDRQSQRATPEPKAGDGTKA